MCETLKAFERQVAKVQLLKLIESQKQQLLKFIEEHNQQMTELELGLLEVYNGLKERKSLRIMSVSIAQKGA